MGSSLTGSLIGMLIGSCQLDRQYDRLLSGRLLEEEKVRQLAFAT